MFARVGQWRAWLLTSAALWVLTALIIAITFDNDAPGGVRRGFGMGTLSHIGTVAVTAAFLTLLVAFALALRALLARGRRRRSARAANRTSG